MKRQQGRFVIEAAVLVPMVCVMLVGLVYLTFYVHDHAVLVHGIYESGVKGIYPDGSPDRRIETKITEDLTKKAEERIFWIGEPKIQTEVSPVRAKIQVTAEVPFLPIGPIEEEQSIYRIQPCSLIRRCRWLKEWGS